MAIQHMDNFAIYGGNKPLMLNGIYAENSAGNSQVALTSDPDGVTAGWVLQLQCFTAILPIVRYVLSSGQPKVGWACRFWQSQLPSSGFTRPQLMSFRDVNNTEIANLTMESTGALTFTNGSNTYTTPGPVVSANGWYHYEAIFDTTSSGGRFDLRIEGVTVISMTGLGYEAPLNINQVAVSYNGSNFGGPQLYLKDWVIYDGTGSTNNDFLGACLVYSMIPDTDVTLGGWTLAGGTSGHAILANAPPQDDVQYINAPFPVPAPTQYTVSDLPPNVTSIKAIMPVTRARKIDGGDGQLQQSVVSGSATGAGANRPITAAYTYWRDIFEYDPATTAAWTVAAANAVNLKLNRTV